MISIYQGKKLIKKMSKTEAEKFVKDVENYYREFQISQWQQWAKKMGASIQPVEINIPEERINERYGIIVSIPLKKAFYKSPKKQIKKKKIYFWDTSAKKEQMKLEQEQREIMEFCLRTSIDLDRYRRLQESIIKATAKKVGISKRKLKDYLEN